MDTKIDKKQVADLYHSGMNMRQIGEVLGVSQSAICKFMIEYNINCRPSGAKASGDKRVKLDKEQVASMYESGMTQKKIGKALGVSNACISKFMKKHDIKARSPGHPSGCRVKLDKQEIASLYESGKSSLEISKMFAVDPFTIRKFMRENSIKLRKDRKKKDYPEN